MKPRIVHYCPTGPTEKGWAGGVEIYVLQILDNLGRDKYETGAFCFYDGFFAEECRRRGIPCRVFPKDRKYSIRPLLDAAVFLRRNKPDILHLHGNYLGTGFGFLPAKLARTKRIVHTIHTLTGDEVGNSALRRFMRGVLDRWVVRSARHVCTVAEAQHQSRLLGRVPKEKLSSIRVCLEPFDIESVDDSGVREELGIEADDTVFINVGRLTEQKGLTYLLKAAKIVVDRHPKSKFVIAGEGVLEEDLKREAKQLGISDKVIFLGFRRDIHRLLKMSDVFVLSSLYEGMPKVLLEAMMAKVPCVSTSIVGVPELMADAGILVPARDVEALATGLLRLAKDPALRRRLGEAGKRRVETDFGQEMMIRRIEDIYEKVLAQG